MSYTARHRPTGDYLTVRRRSGGLTLALEIELPGGDVVEVEYQPDPPGPSTWVDVGVQPQLHPTMWVPGQGETPIE